RRPPPRASSPARPPVLEPSPGCRSHHSGVLGPSLALLEPRIQRVADAVPEQVEAEHGNENGDAGEERQPGIGLNEGYVGLEVPAPARRRGLGAKPEEGERS